MTKKINEIIDKKETGDFREFLSYLAMKEVPFMLRNDVILHFNDFFSNNNKKKSFFTSSSLKYFFDRVQEVFFWNNYVYIMYRIERSRYIFFRIRRDGQEDEVLSTNEYLDIKDIISGQSPETRTNTHIDFNPYYDFYPKIKDPRKIGDGIRFLNRYLSSSIFKNPEEWNEKLFHFMKMHEYSGKQLMVNRELIKDFSSFYEGLKKVIALLGKKKDETPYSSLEKAIKKEGFEPGWGNTAGNISETMQLLLDLLNEPDDELFEKFLSKVPMPLVSKIAIISPHGWFAQDNVLGKPDTGGQVIYILDQVKALEKHLKSEIENAGLNVQPSIAVITRLIPDAGNTTCNVEAERIYDTDNCWILRVPFTHQDGTVHRSWISRFNIWPYLEKFADESTKRILSHFSGRPDLIIGNYSDGNLVASLISDSLDVIQCTIAHALEKTKYLFSDMYWKENEKDYHFSLQFIADLISMNKSDFVIASTYQEITGTETEMGQYEAYQMFSLPGLFQVTGGIDLSVPKFNVIPPGVDETLYFPFNEHELRIESKKKQLEKRLFSLKDPDILGELEDTGKVPIFTMARFDKIKNITGLIEAFGMNTFLQKECNLVFAAGTIHPERSGDVEEKNEIEKAYSLIDRYKLHGKIRWLPSINKIDTGEVYRIIADRKGIFVQPAFFEAFGLTVLEAMLSGVPTFATKFGGPLEIIEDGKSGFLINPSKPEFIAAEIEKFIRNCKNDESIWDSVSEEGINRVRTTFTWRLYNKRLMTLTKLYGFWRFAVTKKEKKKMDNYIDLIYNFLFRERAASIK